MMNGISSIRLDLWLAVFRKYLLDYRTGTSRAAKCADKAVEIFDERFSPKDQITPTNTLKK